MTPPSPFIPVSTPQILHPVLPPPVLTLALATETTLPTALGLVLDLGLVPTPGLVHPGNIPPFILHPVPPVPPPLGNTPTKTSKQNIYYHQISREDKKSCGSTIFI